MKHKNNDNVYYQNNPAKFISYLSDKMAVIIVEAFPDYENTTTHGTCMGCCVGDSDNKLQCTCEDTEHILELLESNTSPTNIPLIVGVSMLFDKPMVVLKHEDELSKIKEVRDGIIKSIKFLRAENFTVKNENTDISKRNEILKEASENYAQIKTITLERFIGNLGKSIAHMMYSENDSRSVVGGTEEKEFRFNGFNYSLKINAYWEKSMWFECIVNGIDIEYNYNKDHYDF